MKKERPAILGSNASMIRTKQDSACWMPAFFGMPRELLLIQVELGDRPLRILTHEWAVAE